MIRKQILYAVLIIFGAVDSVQSQIVADTFNIPNYPVPEIYYTEQAPELPDNVWNQQSEYFPPWFYAQPLADCGQASGLFYCLSYEFNRLLDRPADSTSIFSPLYSYNFLNEGNGWYGVSTFDSWNLVKSQGNMMLSEFNQLRKLEVIDHKNLKGYQGQYWIDGYNYYYDAMKYRISDYYSLNVKTDEDLKILMHYFDDHLRGEETGGCAIFYSTSGFESSGAINTILDLNINPTYGYNFVINDIEGPVTHSLTLTGYYSNTLLDFNSDGFISDSIDINGDEIVDMHDNEKIMWIAVNSHGDFWQHSHFLFTYDLLLQVWNQQVFLPVPDTSYSPALTFKIKLKHPCRNAIKISAGISTDLQADIPERTIDFPIFNFQGGTHGMKGVDTMPDPDVLEFGIDITDILKKLDISGDVKVFMKVDNAGYEQGELQYFSIIKYEGEIPDEHIVVSEPTQISGTSQTYFSQIIDLESNSQNELLNFDYQVDTEFYTNDTNSLNLIPIGGTPPYKFKIHKTNEFSQQLATVEYSDDFHIFSVEWTDNHIKWYIDNELRWMIHSSAEYFPDVPMHIIANLAIQGYNWADYSPDSGTIFPNSIDIDYIKVYTENCPSFVLCESDILTTYSGFNIDLAIPNDIDYNGVVETSSCDFTCSKTVLTELTVTAENCITLNNGFSVELGAEFNANISTCSND